MDERYNGWANFETWNAKLWIDNEEGDSEYWTERAQAVYDESEAGDRPRDEVAAFRLKEELEAEFESRAEGWMTSQTGFFADLLNRSLAKVEWLEIAKALILEVEKES